MRRSTSLQPSERNPRLVEQRSEDRTVWFTETVGHEPPVARERWFTRGGRTYRSWDPSRSKLAGALVHDWRGDIPEPGERWLYLGAATGTTVSHVADLVGPEGRVYSIEASVRPFGRLLAFAERWPNVLPILADARALERYSGFVPLVDGVYTDLAQADQIEIALANARRYLRGSGKFLLALKTSSMGRESSAAEHLATATATLGRSFDLDRAVHLAPHHRAHNFLGGRPRRSLFDPADGPRSPPGSRARRSP